MPCNFGHIGDRPAIICTPTYDSVTIERQQCFDATCKKQTWHVYAYEAWYGPTRCCLRCGRISGSDGLSWYNQDLCPGRGVAPRERERNKTRWRHIWRHHNNREHYQ